MTTRPSPDSALADITRATEAIHLFETQRHEAVYRARAGGKSWNEIAEALGVSRQAARQRFGKERIDENTGLPFISVSSQQTERRDG